MKTLLVRAALVLACASSALAAPEVHTFNVFLRGSEQVPPVDSPGRGSAVVTVDDVTGLVTVSGSFSDLLGDATMAHLHGPAPIGTNGAVVFPMTLTGASSGTFSGSGTVTLIDISFLLNGFHYLSLHSSAVPTGEIRGQIVAGVPFPGWAIGVGAAGLLATAGWRLRRRPRPVAA